MAAAYPCRVVRWPRTPDLAARAGVLVLGADDSRRVTLTMAPARVADAIAAAYVLPYRAVGDSLVAASFC